jgi:hypothetical protein
MTPVLRLIPQQLQTQCGRHRPSTGRLAAPPRRTWIRSLTGSVWIQGIDELDPRQPGWSPSSVTHVPGSDHTHPIRSRFFVTSHIIAGYSSSRRLRYWTARPQLFANGT